MDYLRVIWGFDQTRVGFWEYGEEIPQPSTSIPNQEEPQRDQFKTEVIKVMPLSSEDKRSGKQRWRYRAVVAVGNCKGQLGFASAVLSTRQKAIEKAAKLAASKQFQIVLSCDPTTPGENHTVPKTLTGLYKEVEVKISPSPRESGVRGSAMGKVIMKLVGIRDCVIETKNLQHENSAYFAFALFAALKN